MAQAAPLMPKATAVWLVENTALSFDQVADFCKLHPLEVKAIADGDAAQGIKGLDPIQTGQLTPRGDREGRGRSRLQAQAVRPEGPAAGSQEQEGPALHAGVAPPGPPERDPLAGAQPSGAQGRADHAARRHHQVDDRSRSASAPTGTRQTLQPMDPVTLGLCSQIDLDLEVHRAAKEKPVDATAQGATLLPASETTIRPREPEPEEEKKPSRRAQRRRGVRQAQADRRRRGRQERGVALALNGGG